MCACEMVTQLSWPCLDHLGLLRHTPAAKLEVSDLPPPPQKKENCIEECLLIMDTRHNKNSWLWYVSDLFVIADRGIFIARVEWMRPSWSRAKSNWLALSLHRHIWCFMKFKALRKFKSFLLCISRKTVDDVISTWTHIFLQLIQSMRRSFGMRVQGTFLTSRLRLQGSRQSHTREFPPQALKDKVTCVYIGRIWWRTLDTQMRLD